MPTISGDLRLVTDRLDSITSVTVRARETRAQGTGLVLGYGDPVPVTDGRVSFTALPGPAVLVLSHGGMATETVPLLVPDVGAVSLADAARAATLADDATLGELEHLAAQAVADVTEVRRLRGEVREDAATATDAAGRAAGSASTASTAAGRAAGSASTASTAAADAAADRVQTGKDRAAAGDSAIAAGNAEGSAGKSATDAGAAAGRAEAGASTAIEQAGVAGEHRQKAEDAVDLAHGAAGAAAEATKTEIRAEMDSKVSEADRFAQSAGQSASLAGTHAIATGDDRRQTGLDRQHVDTTKEMVDDTSAATIVAAQIVHELYSGEAGDGGPLLIERPAASLLYPLADGNSLVAFDPAETATGLPPDVEDRLRAFVLALINGASEPEPEPEPRETNSLYYGFGWEDTSNAASRDWAAYADLIQATGGTGADLSIGRAEWSLLPATDGTTISFSSSSGVDRLAPVITTLHDAGVESVRLTVDTMLTTTIRGTHPEEASISANGTVRDALPSAWALTQGVAGQMIEDQVRLAAEVYGDRIDGIILTEMHWDQGSFSDNDRALFTADTGLEDWPRTDDGQPDITDATVLGWLTDKMAQFVNRCAIAAGTVPLIPDVRVNWNSPSAGRPESGHDYTKLLAVADSLQAWAYFQTGKAETVAAFAADVEDHFPGRVQVSLGLWGAITPDEMATALDSVRTHPAGAQVTPVSLLTPEHWDALAAYTFGVQ